MSISKFIGSLFDIGYSGLNGMSISEILSSIKDQVVSLDVIPSNRSAAAAIGMS